MANLSAERRVPDYLRKAALAIMFFLCVFIPIRETLSQYTGNSIKVIPDIFILILFACYSVSIRFRYRFLLHDWLFVAYLAAEFVSTIFINHNSLMPYIFQVRSIGIFYIFYFMVRDLGFGREELRKVMRLAQVMVCLLCLCAIVEIITDKTICFSAEFAKTIWYTNYSRAYSLFCNPNTFSLYLDFVIFISLYCRLCYGYKTPLPFYAVVMIATFLSVSRSGMLILLIGSIFLFTWLIITHHGKLPYLRIIISVVLIVAIGAAGYIGARKCAPLYYERFLKDDAVATEKVQDLDNSSIATRLERTLSKTEIEKSASTGRLYTIIKGYEIFRDYPVMGTGFGVFGSASSMNYRSPIADKYELPDKYYSDNEYAKVVVEGGIVGTALFAAFLLSILWFFRKDPVKLFFCVFFGYFGLFYNIFEVQAGSGFFWFLLGLEKFPKLSISAGEE